MPVRFSLLIALLSAGLLLSGCPDDDDAGHSDDDDTVQPDDDDTGQPDDDDSSALDDDDVTAPVDEDADGWPVPLDCDDADPEVHPGASELCDELDNDCDDQVDEDATDAPTWYADLDGDGYGGGVPSVQACDGPPSGYTATATDCDDLDPHTHPDAVEMCDGLDNDCDAMLEVLELDDDGDGVRGCEGDCDDADADNHPGNDEVCDDADNDCDSAVDEGAVDADTWFADLDGDGHGGFIVTIEACFTAPDGYVASQDDCDDLEADTFPLAPELCDGQDNDCDAVVPTTELDGDGDGQADCEGDCDDADPANFEGNPEVCDGADNDCSGSPSDEETDDDLDGQSECDGDCDDTDPANFDGNPEVCDGGDNDCDWVIPVGEQDDDADGQAECEGDCDDADPSRFDGNPEICNEVDDDCDGIVPSDELDDDGDGQPECEGDCDDADPDSFDMALELCDGIDNDCDGVVPTDELDGDLDGQSECDGDCDDADPANFDGNPEVCDQQDNNCDGDADEELIGSEPTCAGWSCQDIYQQRLVTPPDGLYWIDPDGAGAFAAWCDMNTDGAGWTLVMKQASASGYGSELAVDTWTGWNTPGVLLNEVDMTLDDANMVNEAFGRLPISALRLTASQTWLDFASGAWQMSATGTAYDMLSDANANSWGNLGGAETTPWSAASFTDETWTTITNGDALCWRSGPWFNQTSFEYTDGGIKWGWFFNNECGQHTTDTGEGLGCCGNSHWYRESPWTLYLWAQ